MKNHESIHQGLTLERPTTERSEKNTANLQLLERAQANPSTCINELIALAERDNSAEAGTACIMLIHEFKKQQDSGRMEYYKKKAERCQLNADAHLSLAKMFQGNDEYLHLKEALCQNHVPTIRYILKQKNECERNGWYDLLTAAAVLWSTHPENRDAFEREDAADNARLWGEMPGVKKSDIYQNALKVADTKAFMNLASQKVTCKFKVMGGLLIALLVLFQGILYLDWEMFRGVLWGIAAFFFGIYVLWNSDSVDVGAAGVNIARIFVWIAFVPIVLLAPIPALYRDISVFDSLWNEAAMDRFLDNYELIWNYLFVYCSTLVAILIRLMTTPFVYKAQKLLLRIIGCAVWGYGVYFLSTVLVEPLWEISYVISGMRVFNTYSEIIMGFISVLYMVVLFFGIMIPRKRAKEN